jgi:hypothetical protein
MEGSPLERVALHQTRLRMPGLGLDGDGVALGARGLVLLPTIERLVAWLALFTRSASLAALGDDAGSELELARVRSKLGTGEFVVSFPARTTAQLDIAADVGRLTGGLTFTGTGRYYVQVRDRFAPFGYDVVDLLRADDETDFALHHSTFTQRYARERPIDLAQLIATLEPHLDPQARATSGEPLYLIAEPGVASALAAYLARSAVDAEVGIVELPPASAFDDGPRRLGLFRLASLPARLEGLVTRTPGIRAFLPAGPSVAVEVGHRHPLTLSAIGCFPREGLALLPGPRRDGSREAILIDRLPTMGPVTAVVSVGVGGGIARAEPAKSPIAVEVPLVIAPSPRPPRAVSAAIVPRAQAPLLRRLAYALPSTALEATELAHVRVDDFGDVLVLRTTTGLLQPTIGIFFSELSPGLHVLAGHDLLPACPPAQLAAALGASPARPIFVTQRARSSTEEPLRSNVRAFAIPSDAFVPLAAALLAPDRWGAEAPVEVVELAQIELDAPLGEIAMGALGLAPLRGIE